jgi:hypothetical protein
MLKHFIYNRVLKKIDAEKKGRDIQIYPDDIYLVSYPKSGNTWMRFLLGTLQHEKFNFATMEKFIPDIYVVKNQILKNIPSPRFLKSHEYFHPQYPRVIYIVRDPRSVAVSYYYYLQKIRRIEKNMDFSTYLKGFIQGEYDNFATWDEHIKSWLCVKENSKNFLLIKYEDLKKNTEHEMKKVIEFVNLQPSDNSLQRMLSKSSFESMQENEQSNQHLTKILQRSDLSIPFVRKASIDEWKEYFSPSDTALLKEVWGETMKKLGYSI